MANNINWGKIYESSYFGNTDNGISWGKIYEGIAGGSSLTQDYLNRVLADGGVVESAECIDDNINASIYIKPSGYKNGKIFAQLPKDGSADIDFLRGSLKTKTNKEGNVVDITDSIPSLDYSNGGCPVFNFEPISTNLIQYSNVFDMGNSTTNGTRTQITLNNGIDGIEQVLTSGGRNAKFQIINTTIGQTYTISFYVDELNFSSSDGGNTYCYVTGEPPSLKLRDLSIGRNTLTYTATKSSGQIRIGLGAAFATSNATSIKVGGLQFEEKSSATSYIPNNGSSEGVTRFADQPQPINTTPFNLTSITETFEDGTENVISPVPSSYTISQGRISQIIGQ